jgi:hypothetical protein
LSASAHDIPLTRPDFNLDTQWIIVSEPCEKVAVLWVSNCHPTPLIRRLPTHHNGPRFIAFYLKGVALNDSKPVGPLDDLHRIDYGGLWNGIRKRGAHIAINTHRMLGKKASIRTNDAITWPLLTAKPVHHFSYAMS